MINQIEEVGISDHFRDIEGDLWEEYRSEICNRKLDINSASIKILIGVEVLAADVGRLTEKHYQDLDYIIVENFEDIYSLDDYMSFISGIKKHFDGLIILAHPEIDRILDNLGKDSFIQLLEYLKSMEIPLEINMNWGYWFQDQYDIEKVFYTDTEEVVLMNQAKALVSIGTDSHLYEDLLYDRYEKVMWFLSEPD